VVNHNSPGAGCGRADKPGNLYNGGGLAGPVRFAKGAAVGRWVVLGGVTVACALGAALVCGGPEGGPKNFREIIKPYAVFSKGLKFKGGERASVIASGRGDADLDLYVFDENGNLVAWDDSPLDACAVEWLPDRAGQYSLEVRNTAPNFDAVEFLVR
jgi:hypothetical protein